MITVLRVDKTHKSQTLCKIRFNKFIKKLKPFINLHVGIHYQLRLNLSVNFFFEVFR